ncbi:M56 family metallopeptidase [Actinoplanes flavus]|uniref:M56 family metallopeptidase n=1 Tax=Actinoplanes flavus TaxID=2820290 RepID=A0ABS3UCR4_9ACTN|nr:M56 family metallopeptidase [Actinoplanes flavus]MBO3736574.1 M56 family metallopeptidase [Actinoplanes flavus]
MISILLLTVAATVLTAAAHWLPAASWVYRAPRLGIAAWYAALITGAAAIGCAVAEVLWPWQAAGEHGPLVWLMVRLLAAGAVAVTALVLLRTARAARTIVDSRRRHRDLVRLTGRRRPDLDVTVIEHPQPAAYVAGPSCTVITSGALDCLDGREVAAVLAHERAHGAGRHQLLLDMLQIAALVLPRSRVVATAREQVGRLVEIRADEVATRRHAPLSLARALVAMTTTAPGGGPTAPAGVTAATGGHTAERMHRLMRPPPPLPTFASAVLLSAVIALPVLPPTLAAACRWWPILASCLWDLWP